jgi:tetratricopeptide (TPR) repeat protein
VKCRHAGNAPTERPPARKCSRKPKKIETALLILFTSVTTLTQAQAGCKCVCEVPFSEVVLDTYRRALARRDTRRLAGRIAREVLRETSPSERVETIMSTKRKKSKESADLFQKANEVIRLFGQNPDVARGVFEALKKGKFSEAGMSLNASLARHREKDSTAARYNRALADTEWNALNRQAVILFQQGNYANAAVAANKALGAAEQALGPEHPNVAKSLNNLGMLYYAQGQFMKAEPLHHRALAIREKAFGPNHANVGQSLNNLGILYNAQGQHAKAEPLLRRALAIRTETLGPKHPDVATSLDNLAALYDDQGQHGKAEPLYQRALALRTEALGPDHPDVATTLNNQAYSYLQQRQYAKAEPLFQRALAIQEKALGPNHPDVATSLENLAELYRKTSQADTARKLEDRAKKIRMMHQ